MNVYSSINRELQRSHYVNSQALVAKNESIIDSVDQIFSVRVTEPKMFHKGSQPDTQGLVRVYMQNEANVVELVVDNIKSNILLNINSLFNKFKMVSSNRSIRIVVKNNNSEASIMFEKDVTSDKTIHCTLRLGEQVRMFHFVDSNDDSMLKLISLFIKNPSIIDFLYSEASKSRNNKLSLVKINNCYGIYAKN